MLEQVRTKFFCEREFWHIIELFDWDHVGNDQKVMQKAIEYLSRKSSESIELFKEKLKAKLQVIEHRYTYEKKENLNKRIQDILQCPESFLYKRCAILAAGQKYFDSVLENPAKITENANFDALLNLADQAIEMKESSTA